MNEHYNDTETKQVITTSRIMAIIVAFLLVTFSTVEEVTIGSIKFSGGPHLAAIAAVLILWPLVESLAKQGGKAELPGLLKLEINELERQAEKEYGTRITELRADLEELRKEIVSEATKQLPQEESLQLSETRKAFQAAVDEYRAHSDRGDWRARVEVDKRLAAGIGRLPVNRIEGILEENPNDSATSMAAAVSLGMTYPNEEDQVVAKLLVKLLTSRSERVRYRAARSIERRGKRADTSDEARRIMLDGLQQAIKVEDAKVVPKALDSARQAVLPSSWH